MNIEQIKRFIKEPRYRFVAMAEKGLLNWMTDEEYLKRKFRLVMHEELDLKNPKTFNQKLQWLKIYNRKPIYTSMVDKYEAKQYISDVIGKGYVIPTYGVWGHFDEINFDELPEKFVLKTTHDSGGVVLCKNKDSFDKQAAKNKLEPRLKQNFFWHGREWPYKNVKPRIIAEELLEITDNENEANNSGLIEDYKFMCFNGHVKCSFVCSGRGTSEGLHVTFFDTNWNVMPFDRHYPRVPEGFPKPINYELMIRLAERLSANTPFLRVDFYEIAGKVYAGELTFFPGSGFEEFSPKEWDEKLGREINIDRR